MPTFNKQETGKTGVSQVLEFFKNSMASLEGFSLKNDISTNISGYAVGDGVFVDGNMECGFAFTASELHLIKLVGSSYNTICKIVFHGANQNTDWLRCYTDADSGKDRLITMASGSSIGKVLESSNYTITAMVSKDVLGNTVYGVGDAHINFVYCPETDISRNISWLSYTLKENLMVPVGMESQAVLVKAVNICHPDMVEMKNCYSVLSFPSVGSAKEGPNGAQRYYISNAAWGFCGNDSLGRVSPLMNPAVKI